MNRETLVDQLAALSTIRFGLTRVLEERHGPGPVEPTQEKVEPFGSLDSLTGEIGETISQISQLTHKLVVSHGLGETTLANP